VSQAASPPLTLKDRVVGCLLGGALGDAWGGPAEGTDGALHFAIPQRPVVSDDTEFTLATCESIVESGGIEPENLALHFLRWFQTGRVHGIGSSALKAMRDLAAGAHWALAGRRGEFAAGNGAAMRIAPLAFLLDPGDSRHRVLIRDVCRITHHNDEAYVGALAVVLAIRSVITSAWSPKRTFLDVVADDLPDSAVSDRIKEILSLQLSPSEVAFRFGATGHVVDSVPLALCHAQSIATETLQTVLAKTIGGGGDTDTLASIAGTVVGSMGIPHDLVAAIHGSDEFILTVDEFAKFVEKRGPQIASSRLNF
jgi:ADP-ribosyl-[dinitrogen reductase] hydrolase